MIVYKFEDNRGNLYQYNQRQQELLDDIYECFCGKEYATYHNFWYEKIFDNVYDLESNVKAEQKYHNQICNVKDGVE